jgi:hypothetical protein
MPVFRLQPGIISAFFALITASVFSTPTLANDSIGRVGVGGISFEKSEDIRMASEVLEISTQKIRVEYRFVNDADHDIKTTIVFPMPAYEWDSCESPSCINHKPLRPFSTSVNGKEVPSKLVRRALKGGKDITEQLQKIGLTDTQMFETFAHCPNEGLNDPFAYCDITPAQSKLLDQIGSWKAQETAYWEYTFPAKQEIIVVHEYQPFVGGSYDIPYQKQFGYLFPKQSEISNSEACINEGTWQAIEKHVRLLAEKNKKDVWVRQWDVEYILGTGRNWKGPIEEFTLRIVKDFPAQHVSLCFPGKPKKISNTQFEFTQKNFVPNDKLVVYFYKVDLSF